MDHGRVGVHLGTWHGRHRAADEDEDNGHSERIPGTHHDATAFGDRSTSTKHILLRALSSCLLSGVIDVSYRQFPAMASLEKT